MNQVNYDATHLPDGPQILHDAQSYVNGINAYIATARNPINSLTMLPSEYTVLGLTPQPFTLEDLVSIATLVGGIFGKGGGNQLQNAVLYEGLKRRFGRERQAVAGSPEGVPRATRKQRRGRHKRPVRVQPDHSGFGTFLSFDDPSDPEAPTTVRGTSFPYQSLPSAGKANRASIALPDSGSVRYVNHVVAGAPPPGAGAPGGFTSGGQRRIGLGLGARANAGPGLLAFPQGMSNALLVSGAQTTTGHPVAVMGPQVAYFSPEILMEEDIHGPGIDAAGAAFPGVNLYVELGHGPDYAWSATSAGQNIIDTFAVRQCNPSGGQPSIDSTYYVLHGRCTQMETLTRSESWAPNLADSTAAGSITMQTQRTAYGLVIARARVAGHPVAYTNLRSTYMHELDSAVGFEKYNDPAQMKTPQGFFNAAYRIGYTFNWFYINAKHIAYYNSGQNPVRAPRTDPLFPTWATHAWKGYTGSGSLSPNTTTEQQTSESAHPHTVDQSYLTSWNNKQAPGYNDAATGQQYASVWRSQLLDNNISSYLARGHGRMALTDLINAMGNAGTEDLRGVEVLPYALQIIGNPRGGALAAAVSELRTWVATGAHRISRAHPGASGSYDQSTAVRIMDAWWPLLVKADLQSALGSNLLSQVESDYPINDEPGHGVSGAHLGSSFDVGFYGIVQKDLRAVLGRRVRGALNRVFCGTGSLKRCRAALERSLLQAASESSQAVYPSDGVCPAGDQMCHDSIQFRAVGAITQPLIEWVNRPTFQQAVQIQGP